MTKHKLKTAVVAAALVVAGGSASAVTTLLSEGFNSGVPGTWVALNFSSSVAGPAWFAGSGDAAHFPAQSGAANSYVASSVFIGATDANGNPTGVVDGLLYTPVLDLSNATTLSFYTRTVSPSSFGETLYVGALVNNTTDLLLGVVNPATLVGSYPEGWQQYTMFLGGQGAGATGRFYFEYFLPDASVAGDYIGIDSVLVTAVPEPSTWLMMAGGLFAMGQFRRRRG
jgi:hypothetical protein